MSARGDLFFLYGPPGSGKSTTGKKLAGALELPFYDLDREIENRAGKPAAAIFAEEGEGAFRRLEAQCLARLAQQGRGVVALGGGALLDADSRALAESAGRVLCLTASRESLLARVSRGGAVRPLIGAEGQAARLADLLEQRAGHYASFALQMDVTKLNPRQAAARAGILLGAFRVRGMGDGYDLRIAEDGLDGLGEMLAVRGLKGPLALVSDNHVGPLYAEQASAALRGAGYAVHVVTIPAGEDHKTMQSVAGLCEAFVAGGLERCSTVVALGGGVVTDLAGFAAAIFLRGVRWVAAPTSLLGMADASLGGKTGADLPQGKNLAGAFYPPSLVLADPNVLATLPEVELSNGLAEVVKHGLVDDPDLFWMCARGRDALEAVGWGELVRRAAAVKVRAIEADPYERGPREALNLGHTIGHAVERASGYTLRHGEAVAIGMVEETRLAERLGLAGPGLAEEVRIVCAGLGLPTTLPLGMDRRGLAQWMRVDKKNRGGVVRFALLAGIGDVRTGVAVDLEKDWIEEEGR